VLVHRGQQRTCVAVATLRLPLRPSSKLRCSHGGPMNQNLILSSIPSLLFTMAFRMPPAVAAVRLQCPAAAGTFYEGMDAPAAVCR
jgi:hypothetical protein